MFRHRFSPHNDNAMNVDLDSNFLKDQSPDDEQETSSTFTKLTVPL